MTPIEIIALVLIIISTIKVLVIFVKPNAWLNSVVKPIWKKPFITSVISLILGAVVLYYLLQELTIVQIFASMAFLTLLIAIGFSVAAKETLAFAEKMYKTKGMIKKFWFYTLIWVALMAWVLYTILM